MDYQKSLITADGIEVRHVATKKHDSSKTAQLYVSRNGEGLSLSTRGLCHVGTVVNRSEKQRLSGSSRWGAGLKFVHYGTYVHRAVWMAWNPYGYDTIPKDYQIHHLNGIESDNCYDNLVCLSDSEHKVWDHRMHILRDKLGNLKAVPYDRLRELQAMPTVELQYHLDHLQHVDPEDQMNYEITHHVEFLEH